MRQVTQFLQGPGQRKNKWRVMFISDPRLAQAAFTVNGTHGTRHSQGMCSRDGSLLLGRPGAMEEMGISLS